MFPCEHLPFDCFLMLVLEFSWICPPVLQRAADWKGLGAWENLNVFLFERLQHKSTFQPALCHLCVEALQRNACPSARLNKANTFQLRTRLNSTWLTGWFGLWVVLETFCSPASTPNQPTNARGMHTMVERLSRLLPAFMMMGTFDLGALWCYASVHLTFHESLWSKNESGHMQLPWASIWDQFEYVPVTTCTNQASTWGSKCHSHPGAGNTRRQPSLIV